jgi:PAS domain-containing protein
MEHDLAWYCRVSEQLPGYVFVKDRQGRFVGCHGQFAEFAGKAIDSLLGKPDRDTPWVVTADHFMNDDRRVLKCGKSLPAPAKLRLPEAGIQHTLCIPAGVASV